MTTQNFASLATRRTWLDSLPDERVRITTTPTVNRHGRITPVAPLKSTIYDADRHQNPTPIHNHRALALVHVPAPIVERPDEGDRIEQLDARPSGSRPAIILTGRATCSAASVSIRHRATRPTRRLARLRRRDGRDPCARHARHWRCRTWTACRRLDRRAYAAMSRLADARSWYASRPWPSVELR
jgi:hypothetical protein